MAKRLHKAPAQEALLEYIRDYKSDPEADGNSPSYEECAAALGVGKATIYNTASRLIRKGIIRMNKRGKLVLGGRYIPPQEDQEWPV